MRILLLSPDFPPGKGGIQLLTGKLAEGMASDDLTVLTLGRGSRKPGAPAVDRGRLRVVPKFKRLGQVANVTIYNVFAVLYALATRPEAIIAAHAVVTPAARLSSLLLRRRYVLLLYGQEIPHRPSLVAFGARGAFASVAISRHAEHEALKAGAPAERVFVITPGIDLPEQFAEPAPRGSRPTVVTIARMVDRYKGHDVMIAAIDRLRRETPELLWLVIGDGPLRPKYERMVVERGLEANVTFLGQVSDAVRDSALAEADVFAMPSRVPPGGGGEGFGLVYLEAGAHGVPSVAGDEGGAMDAVEHDHSGLLVDPRDPVAVAEAIGSILSDRELAERLSLGARTEARTRDWLSFSAPIRDLLEPGATLPESRASVPSRTVLAVSHTGALGGAERSLLTQLEADAASGAYVPVLAAPEGPLTVAAAARGIDVELIDGFEPSFSASKRELPKVFGQLIECSRQIADAAARRGANAVHANSVRAALIAGPARLFGSPPVVAHIRDCMPDTLTARIVARLVRRSSHMVVANSRYTADCFDRLAGGHGTTVVYNPVDLAADGRTPPPVERGQQVGPTLVVVGQITPWKGQDLAVRTLSAVKRELPGARLLIAGSVKFSGGTRYENDRYATELSELAAALGVAGDVYFLGEVDDVAGVMAAADIVLVPSWEEPLGRVAIEAMACARPVIATSVGGTAEIIEHGETGLLADPAIPAEWVAAVLQLARDEAFSAELALSGSEAAARFSPGTPETSLEKVYSEPQQ